LQDFDKFLKLPAMGKDDQSAGAKSIRLGAWLVLGGMLAAWALGQFFWWRAYGYPYGAQIGYEAALFGQQFADEGLEVVLTHVKMSNYYPPLYEVCLGLVHAVAGFRLGNALVFNFLLVAITCVSVFLLVRRFADDFGGLVAVALILGHEMVFALARVPMREVAMMAATAWVLWLLHRRKLLWNPEMAAGLGLSVAVGLLFKWTFPIYAALPAIAAVIAIVIREDRNRLRPVLLAVGAGAIAFAVCAPWYLGVLDLSYLAASSANDPHPDPILWLVPFYPKALGYGSFGGLAAGYTLLGLAFLGLLAKRGRPFVPAVSAFGALLLLLIVVPHKSERYVLGALPGLAILIGALASFVPRRWYLRGPLFTVLVVAMAWNFINLSFVSPLFAQDSGSLHTLPDPSCLPAGQQLAQRIVAAAANRATPTEPALLAVHPLNNHNVAFNQDMFPLLVWLDRARDKVNFVGYDLSNFSIFKENLERLDVLVVTKNIWTGSDAYIAEQMSSWADFRSPNGEIKGERPDDPRLRAVIEANFDLAFTQETDCFDDVFVYVHKNGTETP
jgi:Dolichyl-phosphate-mannose-protein mannosyltransferase